MLVVFNGTTPVGKASEAVVMGMLSEVDGTIGSVGAIIVADTEIGKDGSS